MIICLRGDITTDLVAAFNFVSNGLKWHRFLVFIELWSAKLFQIIYLLACKKQSFVFFIYVLMHLSWSGAHFPAEEDCSFEI